jgi:hypothetical protein
MKKQELIIPILNDEYKVIVTYGNPDKIAKVLKAWGHQEHAAMGNAKDNSRRGVCFYTKGCHPVIAMPRKPKTPTEIGTLAHESVHAIEYIFEAISQPMGGELFAHSVGAIVRGVLK